MKKTTRVLLALGFSLLAAVHVAHGLAPQPRLLRPWIDEDSLVTWPPFLHWDLREFPECRVPWALGSNPVPDLDNSGTPNTAIDRVRATDAFLSAFAAWEAVSPAIIGFKQSAGAAGKTGMALDGYNTLGFGDGARDDVQVVQADSAVAAGGDVVTPGPNGILETIATGDDIVSGSKIIDGGNLVAESNIAWWTAAGRLAITGIFCNATSGVIQEADIAFDPGTAWVIDPETNMCGPGPAAVNLRGTATHEIGHFIGIAHPIYVTGAAADIADGLTPTMDAFLCPAFDGNNFDRTLENMDKDPCNFLYCPDLGDAPDPCFGVKGFHPSLVHKTLQGRMLNGLQLDGRYPGAEHIFGIKRIQQNRMWTYEWLGGRGLGANHGDADAECEANVTNRDLYDDGVTWFPNPPVWGRPLKVTAHAAYANDQLGRSHDYVAHKLYANAWMDLNQDCIWNDGPAEHFMDKIVPIIALPPGLPNIILHSSVTKSVDLPLVVNPDRPMWLRCRLDWGEDVGQAANIDGTLSFSRLAAQLGEVEDYPFTCTTRYEQMWFCNPYFFPIPGFSMVVVGAPDPSDQTFSALVNAGDCPQTINPPPTTSYILSTDETVVDYPVPSWIPPFTYGHFGRCRPNYPPTSYPHTTARAHFVTETVPAGTPALFVPDDLKIPTVNSSYYVFGSDEPNYGKIRFTVGAVDFGSGGWIDGPDTLTGEWGDTLRVIVSYRVSPTLVPLANLSPCDPLYSLLPLTLVGTGTVTPEDAFEFLLDTPSDVPPGSYVTLEVESNWSTNPVVNHQLVEFPVALGGPTAVQGSSPPQRLALENYPNPFNPTTTIRYALPASAKVTLAVYDVAGRRVRTLVQDARRPAGVFEVEWDGRDDAGRAVASGVYFSRMTAGSESLTSKMVLLK